MKMSLLASMMASSPVRTQLAKPPLSYPPRIENGVRYPSKNVSFVLEETNGSTLSYAGIPGREDYSRLLIVDVPQRVRWAINHQLSLFPWPTIRPIGLEQPRTDAGYKLSSRPQTSNFPAQRSHAHGRSSLGEAIPLEN